MTINLLKLLRSLIKFLLPERIYSFLLRSYFSIRRKTYYKEINNRVNIPVTDVMRLSRDISPKINAPYEIYNINAVYGSTHVLKSYVGFSEHYFIKAFLQHGIDFGTIGSWDDLDVVLPSYLLWGCHHKEVVSKKIKRPVFSIGAPFFYADSFLSEEKIKSEKLRLGKNLLVFPMHSVSNVGSVFNIDIFIQNLLNLKNEFDSIRICMYFLDVSKKIHEKYIKSGFECVTAGHVYDMNFLARLKSLIMLSDATMTNRIGSYSGFSACLGKPHRLIPDEYYFEKTNSFSNKDLLKITEQDKKYKEDGEYHRIAQMFAENISFKYLPEHFEAVDPYWGFSEVKTKEELREIFVETEELYAREKFVPFR